MQATSLIAALRIAENHYGKDVHTDREYLVSQIDKLRSAMWKEPAARAAYFKRPGCECVECVYDNCTTGCTRNYAAVTFDIGMVGIHLLSHNGQPIELASEPLVNAGCCGSCACKKYEKMIERFPLKRSLPRGYQNKLVLRNKSPKDNGKLAGIKYIRPNGQIEREDLKLDTEGVGTSMNVTKVMELTLPERCDWITAETIGGYHLDAYHPSILAPMHMRAKIAGVSSGQLVQWEGFMEPIKAVFDTDLIEFGTELDITNGLQWLDLHFKTGRSPSEERAYQSTAAMFQNSGQSELAAQSTVPAVKLKPSSVKSLNRGMKWLMR